VAAINRLGAVVPFEEQGGGSWYHSDLTSVGDNVEIVAYIIDDRQGGFVNESYPLEVSNQGEMFEFPQTDQHLAAVIIAEVYHKDGSHRLKVCNDGFTFGIDAYTRARNLPGIEIPFRASGTVAQPRQPQPGHRSEARPGQRIGTGSGVVVGSDLIVTNAHVIEDGRLFRVGRAQDPLLPVAIDPMHDLALLQGPLSGTVLPASFGAHVWLGQNIMAAGYPLMDVLGADLKVTTGNISGLTGGMNDVSRFQFTAPIGSGSSGGAIVDEYGNLMGITSAALSHGDLRERGSISENVNFGIKVSLIGELLSAAGLSVPPANPAGSNDRREVVNRMRASVVSISVSA
jgi:S1-C subfamily serine protease